MSVILWTRTEQSGCIGTDSEGNMYYRATDGETTSVLTPDGRTGVGKTPQEALTEAQRKTPTKEQA